MHPPALRSPPARVRWTLAAAGRLAALATSVLLAMPAPCASLRVRDADGTQWRATEDPADDAQGYVLEHWLADGRPDPHFGRSGRRPLSLSATNDAPTSVRVDGARRIWVAGASIAGEQPQAVVLRYLPDGSPDLRWGIQGKVQLSPGGLAIKPNDLLPLTDGSVLVAGVAANVEPSRAVVFHLLATGALDMAFGQGGTWQRAGAGDGSTATSLAASSTGAVAVAVAVRADKASGEAWSLNDTPSRLVLRQALDASSDAEDLRLSSSGGRWMLGQGEGPTTPGVVAMLHAPETAPPATPTGSAAPDPGQGAFSPFAAEPASDATGEQAPLDSGLPWGCVALAGAACAAVGLLLARAKRPGTAIRSGQGR